MNVLKRRQLLRLAGSGALLTMLPSPLLATSPRRLQTRAIPASGEQLPVIGMGTWQTFNVGGDRVLRERRTQVLEAFFTAGGGMVDCSPMYGSAADVLGFALQHLGKPDALFSAEKVWTRDGGATREQVATQAGAWKVAGFDLVQVHNLLGWREHLPALRAMKAQGDIRYVGITTSHGRRHTQIEQVMMEEEIDFVQLTYNITHREAEQRLLPLARERGIAVIANRPYDGGSLIKSLKRRHALPEWAKRECACQTWADFLLRFIVSHPAVTCTIPATTRVDHMQENMFAGTAMQLTQSQRQRMARYIDAL